jgi:hypothetical protein
LQDFGIYLFPFFGNRKIPLIFHKKFYANDFWRIILAFKASMSEIGFFDFF